MNVRAYLLLACLIWFFAIAIGAFGAHAWEASLTEYDTLLIFNTANRYHFYHAISLLILPILWTQYPELRWQKTLFFCQLVGVMIFSGSLYSLSLTNLTWLGAITPIGGVLLLLSWLGLFFSVFRLR